MHCGEDPIISLLETKRHDKLALLTYSLLLQQDCSSSLPPRHPFRLCSSCPLRTRSLWRFLHNGPWPSLHHPRTFRPAIAKRSIWLLLPARRKMRVLESHCGTVKAGRRQLYGSKGSHHAREAGRTVQVPQWLLCIARISTEQEIDFYINETRRVAPDLRG
jgi:hypothetical protein